MAAHIEMVEGRTARSSTLVQWRAVFAGAVVGLGVFILVSLLWVALAYASGVTFFATSLSWWVGVTAIVSFFIGAYLTGWLSGVRGWAPGLINAITMWGLLVIGATLAGIPALLGSLHIVPAVKAGGSLWATFWSLLIALGTAIIGGIAGGSTPRSAVMYEQQGAAQVGLADQRFRAAR